MVNKRFWLGMLGMALVFGLTVTGCDSGLTDDEEDTWTNITSINQLDGTWKIQDNNIWVEGIIRGDNHNYIMQKIRAVGFTTINTKAKTWLLSGKFIATFSGTGLNDVCDFASYWSYISNYYSSLNYYISDNANYIIIDNANHTVTIPYYEEYDIDYDEYYRHQNMFQINQNGKKLRVLTGKFIGEDSIEESESTLEINGHYVDVVITNNYNNLVCIKQ
jgi:hypothetical protein